MDSIFSHLVFAHFLTLTHVFHDYRLLAMPIDIIENRQFYEKYLKPVVT